MNIHPPPPPINALATALRVGEATDYNFVKNQSCGDARNVKCSSTQKHTENA